MVLLSKTILFEPDFGMNAKGKIQIHFQNCVSLVLYVSRKTEMKYKYKIHVKVHSQFLNKKIFHEYLDGHKRRIAKFVAEIIKQNKENILFYI